MAQLHNRVSNAELRELMLQETEPRITLGFYQYHLIADPQLFRDKLWKGLTVLKVFGRIYVAQEGINAQISVPTSAFEAMKSYLYSFAFLNGVRLNIAVDDDGKSFWVLRVKVREKIVADGIDDPDFDVMKKGHYLQAKEFNELSEQPGTVVIDMRNHYEYEVGHFKNAIEIPSDTFREQLPMAVDMMKGKEDENIIMYCTGGIRCEKASAYMLHHGFKNVFHVEGGIINYVNEVKQEGLEQKFTGKNFVFDERLGERVTDEIISKCHQCGQPADTHTNCNNDACHLLFIQCEACAAKYEGCCSNDCRDAYRLPVAEQQGRRKGQSNGTMIFNKAKERLRPRLGDQ
ncbi:MAG: rhodanese-related sulfurtransferase [Chitinophagaceae bacterium]